MVLNCEHKEKWEFIAKVQTGVRGGGQSIENY